MMSKRTYAPLFLATLCLSGCIGGDDPLPKPDRCTAADTSKVESFEIGSPALDGLFEPWEDNAVIPIIAGGQGSDMIEIQIQIEGPGTSCISQATRLIADVEDEDESEGEDLALDLTRLRVYEQDDGSLLTNPHFLILNSLAPYPYSGTQLTIRTTVAGTTISRSLIAGD